MKIIQISLALTILSFGCSKKDESNGINQKLASVSTAAITSITDSSAISGGIIISDSTIAVLGRGVCWSTAANPTFSLSTKTLDSSGTGNFISKITGLSPNATYHIRAYASTAGGTAYGEDVVFTTKMAAANLEKVTIGGQTWALKHLDISAYRNGDPIPEVTDPNQWKTLTTGAWCWYNNDSATYAAVYGKLYNWYAINDSRGIAPEGWRVPGESDWHKLLKFLDAAADTTCSQCIQSTKAGGALKEIGITNWNYNNTNVGATNSSGFTALPGGIRNELGVFSGIRQLGYYWSADSASQANKAWTRLLYAYDKEIGKYYIDKKSAVSVRLIRN